MIRFKVGDKIISHNRDLVNSLYIGVIGIITKVNERNYRADFPSIGKKDVLLFNNENQWETVKHFNYLN